MYDNTQFATLPNNPLAVLDPQPKEPRYYTLAEYLRREERSQELHEYYDGMITKLPMARGPHNMITANMVTALNNVKRALTKKYLIYTGQQAVYLPKLNFSLYPDVLTVVETPQYFDRNQVLLINPLVIIEVLSKSTKKYDRVLKFDEYKTLDSFKEYILIDQKKCHIQVRYREEPGLWRETTYENMNDTILLKSMNCTIFMTDIYENIVF